MSTAADLSPCCAEAKWLSSPLVMFCQASYLRRVTFAEGDRDCGSVDTEIWRYNYIVSHLLYANHHISHNLTTGTRERSFASWFRVLRFQYYSSVILHFVCARYCMALAYKLTGVGYSRGRKKKKMPGKKASQGKENPTTIIIEYYHIITYEACSARMQQASKALTYGHSMARIHIAVRRPRPRPLQMKNIIAT